MEMEEQNEDRKFSIASTITSARVCVAQWFTIPQMVIKSLELVCLTRFFFFKVTTVATNIIGVFHDSIGVDV